MSAPTPPQAYTLQVDRAAAAQLDHPVQARLLAAIAGLATQPRPAGVKALTGHRGLLRIRSGSYRIVYTVRDEELIVLVVHLGHRSDGYDVL
ncbi:type II toxin-antitoxin system RelE family toxin [Micromonospora carbonacea]|uniref:type II toxin-antitoxin system RelE family toxin n=1 Tax=Micromonospora carbonacea TaxID=47853 RepID=UPI003D968203